MAWARFRRQEPRKFRSASGVDPEAAQSEWLKKRKGFSRSWQRRQNAARSCTSLGITSLKLKGWAGDWKHAIIVAQKRTRARVHCTRQIKSPPSEWKRNGGGRRERSWGKKRNHNGETATGISPDAFATSHWTVIAVVAFNERITDCEHFRFNKRPDEDDLFVGASLNNATRPANK